MMTELLKSAFNKIKKLPEAEQDRFANMLLSEVAWQEKFNQTQNELDCLGKKVLAEIQSGKFKKIKN